MNQPKINVNATLKVTVILTLSDGIPKPFEYQSNASMNNNNKQINLKVLVNELFDKIIKKVPNNLLPKQLFVINPNVIGTILVNVTKNNVSQPSFTIPLPNLPFNSIPIVAEKQKSNAPAANEPPTPGTYATKSSLRRSQVKTNNIIIPININ